MGCHRQFLTLRDPLPMMESPPRAGDKGGNHGRSVDVLHHAPNDDGVEKRGEGKEAQRRAGRNSSSSNSKGARRQRNRYHHHSPPRSPPRASSVVTEWMRGRGLLSSSSSKDNVSSTTPTPCTAAFCCCRYRRCGCNITRVDPQPNYPSSWRLESSWHVASPGWSANKRVAKIEPQPNIVFRNGGGAAAAAAATS